MLGFDLANLKGPGSLHLLELRAEVFDFGYELFALEFILG